MPSKGWARAERLEPYDQETQSGYLRHLVVREGRNTGEALVMLVTGPGERFDADFFVETVRRFPEVKSIHWAINDSVAEVTNLPSRLLWGQAWIEEEILGLRFRVRPNAFLQTNTEMAETLYELALAAADLSGHGERLRPLLRHRDDRPEPRGGVPTTCGAWRSPRRRLRARSRTRPRTGSRTHRSSRGTSGSRWRSSASAPARPTSSSSTHPVRASPARRSGEPGRSRRRESSTSRAIPTTLASDLAVLRDEYGYVLRRCTPVDMFPHTPHIESVNLLERVDPPPG